MKVLWIFLIFALTSNTKGFASAIDLSLSIASFTVVSTDCDSTDLSALSNKIHSSNKLSGYCRARQNFFCVIPLKIRGKKGRYEFSFIFSHAGFDFPVLSPSLDGRDTGRVITFIPAHAGIQSNSPLTRGAGWVSSFHPTKKLSTPGSAIADTGSSSLTLNCVSIDPIQQTKITSNNLSDIFIPPK